MGTLVRNSINGNFQLSPHADSQDFLILITQYNAMTDRTGVCNQLIITAIKPDVKQVK